MGFYLQTDAKHGKAEFIRDNHAATIVTQEEAEAAIDNPDLAVVVVVSNGPFEAAGFAFDRKEFEAFTSPDDRRPKKFFTMDRTLCRQLTDFPNK